MSSSYQKGKDTFNSGFYCAESVLKVITEEENISSPLLPGIATGLCSGMSRTSNMCGALTGGILALNIVFGRNTPEASIENNYKAVQKLIAEFEHELGSSNCQELLGCDLNDENGQKKFHQEELHLKCAEFTGKAAELVRTIIDNERR